MSLPTKDNLREQATYPALRNGGESRITARVVSRGAAIGQAVCLHGQKRQFYRIELATEQIAAESERLDFAVKAATQQLSNLASARNSELPDTLADIFDVHLLILKDSSSKSEMIV